MTRKKKSFLQYSKKLSTAVTGFWIFYRVMTVCAAIWRPEISEALTKLVSGVDSVMMVNLGFYCGNSVSEKAIMAWMQRKEEPEQEEEDESVG